MKRNLIIKSILLLCVALNSCSRDFLDKLPQGELSPAQVESREGVEGLLIGAYGLLNGNVNGTWGNYASAPSQWLFGEVASDNAHKGSTASDQPNMGLIESHQPTSTNDNLSVMWRNYYEGIARCNSTLRTLTAVQSGTQPFSAERAAQIQGEARLLRAHYYFLLRRLFEKIPYIDETISTVDAAVKPNDEDVYPMIEADLRFALENLAETKYNNDAGRVDKTVARAYLGKVLLYLKRYQEALPFFTEVINSRPSLVSMEYWNNFNLDTENGPEAIFSVQHAINPDGSGDNANVGDMLSGLYGTSPVGCCGFYQPTIDLVNAYKTDATGLPYLDNSYRTNPYVSDFGLAGAAKDNYRVNTSLRFDPRLDYNVGRRGVQYLDYGIMPGDAWIRDPAFAGPFIIIKTMVPQSKFSSSTVAGAAYITALNVNLIRLSDVYLMAAECNIELGNLPESMRLINLVRQRAANIPPKTLDGTSAGTLAANYVVGQYVAFPSADYARTALRFERRLELAFEGHRFYDLVRWGIAQQVVPSYAQFEGSLLPAYENITFEPRNAYYPLPQDQIDQSRGTLQQSPDY